MDECWDWADKAAALASYARQSNDETLQRHAIRIQSRAIERCGLLMKQIPSGSGSRNPPRSDKQAGDHPLITCEQAADEAGLSEHQRIITKP
jgi:hypothetical protein